MATELRVMMRPSACTVGLVIASTIALVIAVPCRAASLRGEVVDADTGRLIAARVYIERLEDGTFHFARSTSDAAAVAYDKVNWINPRSVERHTSLPAAPFEADLPAGRYRITVERGKQYLPEVRHVEIGETPQRVRLPLRRWIDMAELGWYSGETHIHRPIDELPVVMDAEELNVALPLSYWVTEAFRTPAAGDRTLDGRIPDELVQVGPARVIWPRNTEYEIFSVGEHRHTLGALFVLNHTSELELGAPPWKPVAEQARGEGALLDMDKLDWPFAMTLPYVTGATLYQLANNHLWRTEFAFRDWNTRAPPFMLPPYGAAAGGERDWLHYTLGMYYTLLNAGFRLVPTAGTASGVHPVPVGFSRVYVHLPDGFRYDRWIHGLARGRSFVTTGPMLLATVNERHAGASLEFPAGPATLNVSGTVVSDRPLTYLEVVVNGRAAATVFPANRRRDQRSLETEFSVEVDMETSGWVCVRALADDADGRVRFAHTAPWWIEIVDRPLQVSLEEKQYLVRRVEDEIARSAPLLPAAAQREYQAALDFFRQLDAQADDSRSARAAGDDRELQFWLENMIVHHQYSDTEIRAAVEITPAALADARAAMRMRHPAPPATGPDAPLRVLPYPGGRHPRTGFRDGAIDPQRETKVSVFLPWDASSYVVVDVPEALFADQRLLYLAHTHIPTIWSEQGIELPPLEWSRRGDGSLDIERRLPDGLRIGARIVPQQDAVQMELWVHNGSDQPLTGLRAQTCVLLQAAAGFHQQSNHNKLLADPFVACRDASGERWIITAWTPTHRVWANPPCPCMHSDPAIPDCLPGETSRVHGWLSFYEGPDIEGELDRIRQNWLPERSSAAGWTPSAGDHR